MTKSNTMFTGGQPTWANACVGENGSSGYRDYAKGFSQASDILINTILLDKGTAYPVDSLVYPVCFNMRHSVELRLKDAILELIALASLKGYALKFDLAGSHDIGNIWSYFSGESQKLDDRYASFIEEISGRLEDLAKVDATGQTFRYPLDTKNKKHLSDTAIINFVALKEGFTELESKLDELHYFHKYLLNEYVMGTNTKKLSRRNLFELANYLPSKSCWKDKSFARAKKHIKQVFDIGSKELSDGIKIIENHYELAPLLGMAIPLLGVDENDIDEFLFHWVEYHTFPLSEDSDAFDENDWKKHATLEVITEDAETREKIWHQVHPRLTPEKLAGILALYRLAEEDDFSEYYKPIYEELLVTSKLAFEDSENSILSIYFHVFGRKSVGPNILRTLYFLKKTEEAERFVAKYSLMKAYPWLSDARNGNLFVQSRYCENAI